jgi:cysteine desulfurase/selenocysteine lyase
MSVLDISALRAQFPVLSRQVHGKPLIYFDNANTSQKPLAVIEAVDAYHRNYAANVARAVHTLGEEATRHYEASRDALARWLGAAHRNEIVLTRGTTEAINLVAYSFLRQRLRAGDVVLATQMEHHANIVPWQLIAAECGASVVPVPISDAGELDLQALEQLLAGAQGPVRLLAVTHVSNALGTINPIAQICAMARAHDVVTVVDGSQAAPHLPLQVNELGADFYVCTGHKLFAPTGTGALWASSARLQQMVPFLGGGEMIRTVSFAGTTFVDPPHRFEAGTPNISGHIGLAAAINWLEQQDFALLREREDDLGRALEAQLRSIDGLRLIGEAKCRVPVYSFVIDGAHAHDLALLLDEEGIAVRSGQHCAHPLMQRFGVAATLRASLSFYNTFDEIEGFANALRAAVKLLRG